MEKPKTKPNPRPRSCEEPFCLRVFRRAGDRRCKRHRQHHHIPKRKRP